MTPLGAAAEAVSTILRTPRLLDLVAIGCAADPAVPLLICGEPGVGKDTLARLIHEASARSRHAFIKVNCAARAVEHHEADLFGHEKDPSVPGGRRRPGSLEFANEGTLYLDEIGALSCSLVRRLLRVMEAGEVSRCGGNESIHVDVRLIASTAEGTTRAHDEVWQGLRRLKAVEMRIPPLREGREEIEVFAAFFFDRFNRRYRRDLQLCPDVIAALRARSWPGNLRELEEAVLRLVVGDPSRDV